MLSISQYCSGLYYRLGLLVLLHPPGGATALIAVIGGSSIHSLGFLYLIFPVKTGALIMPAVALLVNNIPVNRRYPASGL